MPGWIVAPVVMWDFSQGGADGGAESRAGVPLGIRNEGLHVWND